MEYKFNKEPSKELVAHIEEKIAELDWYESAVDHLHISDGIEIGGENYNFDLVYEGSWEGVGKYQYSDILYQLVSYDNTEYNYPCTDNIIDRLNLFFEVPVTRTGSYYSDYYYTYDKPKFMQYKMIRIPEQVIQAHDIQRLEEIGIEQ